MRFACGSPGALFSGVWRMVVNRNDVYLGASKAAMSILKISLHHSGVWVLAATEQSGAKFDGNRRAKRWAQPLGHAPGVVRGPSILVPRTSLGSRPTPPDEPLNQVAWFAAPGEGEAVEFSLYLV